ncbi:MAG: helix-turn-helix transcriptional regulator [Clostridiales bacterium]|nr:helix-turn-helix transcriptional regulator [Clostridiales bacterium]
MENFFSQNLRVLTNKYSQKYVADKTGFSQSSINNYLTKGSEPSIQFLIALKNAFNVSIDDFLFSHINDSDDIDYSTYVGNYLMYYYNNSSYKGEIHVNAKNTLHYGVLSVLKIGNEYKVYALLLKERYEAVKLLKTLNSSSEQEIMQNYKNNKNSYEGEIHTNAYNIFISLKNFGKDDEAYIILNNPMLKNEYLGGLGTINSVSKGREHNPCLQYIIISRRLIDKTDGELYNSLSLDYAEVDMIDEAKELVSLFKRLYIDKNALLKELDEEQKLSLIENRLNYYFTEVTEANMFRIGKISNYEDDVVYRLLKEGINV